MPRFAAIILIIVFIIGISTAAFSESFIESSHDLASFAGLTGSMKILVTDQSNKTLSNVKIKIDDFEDFTNSNGYVSAENIELGIQELSISKNNYKNQTREILISPFFKYESTIILENESGQIKNIDFNSSGCAIIIVIFSIIALIGSIACLKRQHFDIAIICAFIGIFSFGFFLIGSILAIIAFIFIFRSKEEFENGKKGKIF